MYGFKIIPVQYFLQLLFGSGKLSSHFLDQKWLFSMLFSKKSYLYHLSHRLWNSSSVFSRRIYCYLCLKKVASFFQGSSVQKFSTCSASNPSPDQSAGARSRTGWTPGLCELFGMEWNWKVTFSELTVFIPLNLYLGHGLQS